MNKINWPLTVAVVVMIAILVFLYSVNISRAQEHHHPAQDQAIHEKFYSTWMMPDHRTASCCHNEDCSPAESKFEDGRWWAKKVGDDNADFTEIPDEKVERDRDTPDGRSHVCGRSQFNSTHISVFCFIPGNGG